jgi:hypothetical protein
MSENLREVLEGHAANVNSVVEGAIVLDDEVSDEDLQERILAAVDGLSDPDWKKLGALGPNGVATQQWATAIFKAEAAGKEAAESEEPDPKKVKSLEAEKKKAEAAKAAAKKKAAASKKGGAKTHYNLFQKGCGSDQIYQIVKAAGTKGITEADVIAAAEKGKIKSTNIAARVKDLLKMCSVKTECHCYGIMTLDDKGLYRATPEKELEKLRKAEAAEAKDSAGEKKADAKDQTPGKSAPKKAPAKGKAPAKTTAAKGGKK